MKLKNLLFLKNNKYLNSSCCCLYQNNVRLDTQFVRTVTKINYNNENNRFKFQNKLNNNNFYAQWGVIGVLSGVGLYFAFNNQKKIYADSEKIIDVGLNRDDLPTFTLNQVQEHNSIEKGVWVVYKNGVYDITKFIESHPGGSEKIILAAGSSIEPFWSIYAHHHKNEVYEILEELRIGNLNQADIDAQKEANKNVKTNDAFQNEPQRHPLLKVINQKPFNAETPTSLSVDSIITPNEIHFKRNHLPVPIINIKEFKLDIFNDLSNDKKSLTIDDIKTKFPIHTLPVTIQCAGNRRKGMNNVKPVQGLMWGVNAISTAEWTGVKLKDILEYLEIDLKNTEIKHIQFVGLDSDPTGATYGASIPIDKVLSNYGDVLIAFQMNGVDIPMDHGYPLRAIVPGVIGARSVKWLNKIILSKEESKSHWQQKDYKLLSPTINNLNEADFSKVKSIQEAPVQSAICEPLDGAIIKKENETFKIKGYAYSGGGNSIESVLISLDDGQSWKQATLIKREQQLYRAWAWTLWELEVEIPQDKDDLKIICVATDSNENTQPETVKSLWNLRGLLNNSWHFINVKLK